MATRRNAADRERASREPGAPIAGLASRAVARSAVADLLGKGRALALEDALAQAGRNAGLDAADAGLARAIATATFRRLGFLRAALGARMAQGLPQNQPRLVALLATGAAQILDLAVPDHAAVDLAVRLAKAEPETAHLGGLVNAVLRRVARERAEILAAGDPLADNTPDWLARRWRAAYGEAGAQAIARAHLAGPAIDLTVRADPAADPATWAERLGATLLPTGSLRLASAPRREAIPTGEGPAETGDEPVEARAAIASLPGYAEGAWWVQDAAAALPARLLGTQAGERVADLCAAPGGKTAQIAATGAAVTAVDRSAARLERLRENLARLRLDAEVQVGDALALDGEGTYDAVLLDAPCSATGTIRRHPDVAWTKSEADLARLVALQARLLDKAAALVRPGGRLVYCTCSLEPEESEAQLAAFLARHDAFARVPLRPEEVGDRAELIDGSGDLRTLPSHLPELGGLDGFFASRLTRLR
ncbi:RsmB/NOP family class I SAM-dependent RNA methyltransferase [Methylobacterium sp. A54F]